MTYEKMRAKIFNHVEHVHPELPRRKFNLVVSKPRGPRPTYQGIVSVHGQGHNKLLLKGPVEHNYNTALESLYEAAMEAINELETRKAKKKAQAKASRQRDEGYAGDAEEAGDAEDSDSGSDLFV